MLEVDWCVLEMCSDCVQGVFSVCLECIESVF